ncbi:hypothetical protein TWF281_006741 [Arthrobotrys megalospora]
MNLQSVSQTIGWPILRSMIPYALFGNRPDQWDEETRTLKTKIDSGTKFILASDGNLGSLASIPPNPLVGILLGQARETELYRHPSSSGIIGSLIFLENSHIRRIMSI